ncbi:hypothetical protein KSP40_PGU020543 [Platanthera guangdongensis]|uniref:Uncharacterized protein n=1 Tax=Platanthera guangdongensis TaxID=2320717 RepID=A0ABR2LN42_9ASPA
MGQSQSSVASDGEGTNKAPSPSTATRNSSSLSSPSMEDLIAEAMSEAGDENETLDQKAQRALECPCVADLRKGPCGFQFSEAFVCFIKSTAEEKGSDCVRPFVALQNCIRANPDAFSKEVLEEKDDDEVYLLRLGSLNSSDFQFNKRMNMIVEIGFLWEVRERSKSRFIHLASRYFYYSWLDWLLLSCVVSACPELEFPNCFDHDSLHLRPQMQFSVYNLSDFKPVVAGVLLGSFCVAAVL